MLHFHLPLSSADQELCSAASIVLLPEIPSQIYFDSQSHLVATKLCHAHYGDQRIIFLIMIYSLHVKSQDCLTLMRDQ